MKRLHRKRNTKAQVLPQEIAQLEWRQKLKECKDLIVAVAVVKQQFTYTETATIRLYADFMPEYVGGPKIIRTEVIKGRILGLWNERIFAELLRQMRLHGGWPKFIPEYFIAIYIKRGNVTITVK